MNDLGRSVVDDSSIEAGISWGGFNLSGDVASIREVLRLISLEERLRWFEYEYRALLDAGCPCKRKTTR